MFVKNRVHFMNAYYKETEKPFGYLLVDNKPDTPADQQILADLFGECYVYHFGVNSTEPTRVENQACRQTQHSNQNHLFKEEACANRHLVQCNYFRVEKILGAPGVRKIPEGYVIIEMYNTSCNTSYQPVRGGVEINGENYWPVKLKHRSTGHTKWSNLHSDEPAVQSIVKETMRNTTEPKINYYPK